MSDAGSNAAAGWYPDPEDASRWRYWDGSAWSPVQPESAQPLLSGQELIPVSPTTKPVYRRWWFITAAAFLALVLVSGIVAALGTPPTTTASSVPQSAPPTPVTVPTSPVDTQAPPTETPAEAPVQQEPAPVEEAAPAPPPVPSSTKYSGRGDKIVTIKKPESGVPQIMTLTYRGSSNFVIESLDSSLETTDLLVNEIGSYRGSVLLDADGGDSPRVKVTAAGPWTMEIKPRSAAPTLRGRANGRGDQVLKYFGGPFVISATHSGSSNFVIQAYGDSGGSSDLLVNEIGRYSGENTLSEGPGLVAINADGSWTVSVS